MSFWKNSFRWKPDKREKSLRHQARPVRAKPVGKGRFSLPKIEQDNVMRKLGSTWLPFLKGDSAEQNMTGVTERMNEMVAEHDLQVLNVETVYQTNWLGRPVEPCGIRVWWLAESPLSAQELVQPLFDQINT